VVPLGDSAAYVEFSTSLDLDVNSVVQRLALAILKAKVPIVSTTEELSYPGYTHIRQARQIHALAKKAKVAVLGTGVNPGFAMDSLPIALSAV